MTLKKGTLIALRAEGLNDYHYLRAERHGYLFVVHRAYGPLVEARSLATGRVCTLDTTYLERTPDG